MQYAAAMVGNSSSGIIEAASFRLPVLNIGDRQRGRVHGKNVIDVPCLKANIKDAIIRCADTGFKKELAGFSNPYGDGKASDVVVRIIKSIPLGNDLIIKRFYNLSSGESH
jgi:UDP-N-acetylglucosamine 2-epimerase